MIKLVTASHICPEYTFDRTEVVIGESNYGEPRFYASHPKLGCGKDSRTIEGAIAILFRDHACTVLKIEDKPETENPMNTRLPTYEQMAKRARALHQENFDRDGDAYATAEELEFLLDDPLALYELVYDQLTVETGAFIEKWTRSVVWADELDLERCKQRVAETRAYRQERSPAPPLTQEQIDAAVSDATHAAFEALVASNIPMPADHLTALYSLNNYLEQFVREALDA